MLDRLAGARRGRLVAGVVVTLAGAVLLFLVWPMPQVESYGGGPIPDTQGFSAGTVLAAYLQALTAEGRHLYAIFLLADLAWTLFHGLTLSALIAAGTRRLGLPRGVGSLALAPLLGMALDMIENSAFLLALAAYPQPPPVPVGIMNLVTGSKLVAVAVAYLGVLVVATAWLRARSDQPSPTERSPS